MSRLDIRSNAVLFARLAKGDESAIADVVTRAEQNTCTFIGLPNGVSTQMLHKVQDALEGKNIKVDFVNYTLNEGVLRKAEAVIRRSDRSAEGQRRQKTRTNSSGQFADPTRRKAHKNKRSIQEQARRKKERADAERARRSKCKGASAKKDD